MRRPGRARHGDRLPPHRQPRAPSTAGEINSGCEVPAVHSDDTRVPLVDLDASLRQVVRSRLDELDEIARDADPEALLPLARTEISRLAEGWRLLLTVHEPDENGRCRACPRRLWQRWPCRVWRMAHDHLIGGGLPHSRRAARGGGRSRRAR